MISRLRTAALGAGDLGLGAAIAAFGLGLALVLVPVGVVRPRNVANIVLSPDFWPAILAWLLVVAGGLVALAGLRSAVVREPAIAGAPPRMAGLIAVMAALALSIQVLGMVWAAMAAALALIAITRPKAWLAAAAAAVVLPFLLYLFFNHLAGVPVPQGVLVRLP